MARRSIAVCWPLQSQILAQGCALVVAAEQPSVLKFRNHQLDKIVEPAGQVRGVDEKSIHAVTAKPVLHFVNDLDGRPDQRALAAGAGKALVYLPDAQPLFACPAHDVSGTGQAGERIAAFRNIRKGAVKIVFREVEITELVRQQL